MSIFTFSHLAGAFIQSDLQARQDNQALEDWAVELWVKLK